MSRDHTKLKVFELADTLVVEVYQLTKCLPAEERYGLQSQIRRAAVSVPTNIVEGCTRKSSRELVHFMRIALGSASEVRYLLDLGKRLTFFEHVPNYDGLVKAIDTFIRTLEQDL